MARGRLALVVVLGASSASADPVRLELSGDACDAATLESQVARLAGVDPFEPAAVASVRVAFEAEATPVATLAFDDGHGTVRGPRTVRAPTCDALVESIAIVVAMALAAPPPPAPEPAPAPPPPPIPKVDVVIAAPLVERERVLVVAAGGTASADGLLAQLAAGIRWQHGARSLTAELRIDTPEDRDASPTGRVSVVRSDVVIGPCLHAGAFAGCVLAGAGVIHGSGEGLTASRGVFAPVVFAGARLTWEHALTTGLAVQLRADIDALLTTTRFDVNDMPVWTSPRVEAVGGIGLLAHFP